MRRVRFHDHAIEIRQYEFQTSSLKDKALIPIEEINEVNLNTYPHSIVINHNEVVFIENKYQQDFVDFVRTSGLQVENRFDIWAAINEEFLDTEFTEQHKERTLTQLEENGISRNEATEVREEIRDLMSGWASVTWEWNYLGHYDLLLNKKQSFLLLFPKDFYWWSMEIALRNYKKK